jgi:hypothetical protein
MNSDEDKMDTKIIDLDEIYNFVVQIFSFVIIFHAQIIDTMFISKFWILDFKRSCGLFKHQ